MKKIVTIVEGYGDVAAVPSLISKTGEFLRLPSICLNPIRAGEWKFLRGVGKLERFLDLAWSRAPDQILVILDLDDGCVAHESAGAKYRIDQWINGREIKVGFVLLAKEYEAIFLHCLSNIDPQCQSVENADSIRDAKGRLSKEIGRRYKETRDQISFTKMIDLSLLFVNSRHFRKLCRELSGQSYDDLKTLLA